MADHPAWWISAVKAGLLVLGGAVGAMTPGASGQTVAVLTEDATLHGDGGGSGPGAPGDGFGTSVAIDGDTALVGAPGSDAVLAQGGLATVFRRERGSWVEEQRLWPRELSQGDALGLAVAVSGDTVLVGTRYDDQQASGAGAVYVFVRREGTWTEEAKLVAPDAAAYDGFGSAVALAGDLALVGSPDDDDAGDRSGSAYLFARDAGDWSLVRKLTPDDLSAGDQFGTAVTVSREVALVGSPRDDDPWTDSGSVYVFADAGGIWGESQKLTAPAPYAYGYRFGEAVALAGDTALVGAPRGDGVYFDSGTAYVFVSTAGAWWFAQQLDPTNGSFYDNFGQSVALSGDLAVVGMPYYDDPGGSLVGAAWVFARSGGVWGAPSKLTAADAGAFDSLAWSVDVSDGVVLAGAPYDDDGGEDSGAAYAFAWDGGAWSQEGKLTGAANPAYDYFGWPIAASSDTVLIGAQGDVEGGVPSGSAYLFARSGGGWALERKLVPDAPQPYAGFGGAAAVRGDVIVVGASEQGYPGTWPGAAYVFGRSGGVWTQDQKLIGSDAPPGGGFGASVALDRETLLVSAWGVDSAGSVYVFDLDRGSWTEVQRLQAPQPTAYDQFGFPCAVEGDTALVGVPGDDEAAPNAGAVYVFERAQDGLWVERQKLMASDAAEGDSFGWVALSGNTALVGAFGADDRAGAVYAFERDGGVWLERQRLTPANPVPGEQFGFVSLAGDVALVGAFRGTCAAERSGAVHVFERGEGVWSERLVLCASDGQTEDFYGLGLALAGGFALVGAPLHSGDGFHAGVAYQFSLPLFADGFESGDTSAWSEGSAAER